MITNSLINTEALTTYTTQSQYQELWGMNDFGGGALNNNVGRGILLQVSSGSTWVSASMGYYNALAISSNGSLWGWGAGSYVGDNTGTNRSSPVQIGTRTDWTKISVGGQMSAAIRTDGTLWTWGQNTSGQLGDGTTTFKQSPVQIGTETNWLSADAAKSFFGVHMVAVKTDGTLWGWGSNDYGQIAAPSSSIEFNTLNTTQTGWNNKLTANGTETQSDNVAFSIKTDGTLWAWGRNDNGQLGNSTLTSYSSPIQVSSVFGGDTWVNVAGGWYHSYGLKS